MKGIVRRCGATRLAALGALVALMLCVSFFMQHPQVFASGSGGGEVVSSSSDMDGDGEPNTVETHPDEGAGEVHIIGGWSFGTFGGFEGGDGFDGGFGTMSGGSGGGGGEIPRIRLRGRNPGDRFGESVAILNDVNGNGAFDLFIGAPRAGTNSRGEAYLFYGPFEIPPGQTELIIDADDADVIFTSFFDDDEDFGRRVAPLHDLTGNGRPELRVQSMYTHADGVPYVFTQVFSGSTGDRMFTVISTPCPVDFWARLTGDTLGDQAVTEHDLDRVTINFGLEGEDLTPFDGDVNSDGFVNSDDLMIVLDNIATLGSLFVFGMDVPEVDPSVMAVLNYLDEQWYASTADSVPVWPGNPYSPIRPSVPCWPSPDCTLDPWCVPPGGGCSVFSVCDPACGWDLSLGISYGPCHPDCPGKFCNSLCGSNMFGEYGPCHLLCATRACNLACGGDEHGDYGPCHLSCPNRTCNPDCGGDDQGDFEPCHPDCEDYDPVECGDEELNCDDPPPCEVKWRIIPAP